jgi:hypothetical protein
MTTYVPDADRYQQIELGGVTGSVDCTAWGAAFRTDAHTKGGIKITGRSVRLHSDEPIPDPGSPGLNLGQVDTSVYRITGGKVDFDTRVQSRTLNRADVRWRISDGRYCGMSVMRNILVQRGFGGDSDFGGSHDITVFARENEPDQPVMFDSLVPYLQRVSWDAVFDAAEALTGRIYAQFTRDLTPDYHAVIPAGKFYTYRLDNLGRIVGSTLRKTDGINRKCSVPRYHPSATNGISGRYLVQMLEGNYLGKFVNARFAEELEP